MKRMSKKSTTLAILLVLVLVVGFAVSGTLAWLTDETDEVKNTFTTSDVDIDLAETTTDYKMVPGATIAKNPKVTVLANSEKCWLFVKVDKSANFDTFMEYDMADGWNALVGEAGVYYRSVETSTTDQGFAVIKDDTVTVNSDVTKIQMNALTAETYPTLTFTAYACQFEDGNTGFTATQAWEILNTPAP